MDNPQQEQAELDDILQRLREDGQEPGTTADERLRHLWRLYLRSEGSLRALTQDLEEVRSQQVAEMKEVENYVDHIRNLSEEREALTAEYERENEQLRGELQQLRLEQEAHLKEVEEMLDQEGLAEISHSSPSEQIAYLLVERATLLEKLESAERKLDSQSYTGSLREEELDQIRQTLEEELRQQRESMQRTKETMNKVENYVDHIRNLSEEREALTAEYERENEQLRGELQQLRLEQEAHLKEVEEMLDQEGLAEISHSSPSEQIAYLLVERATLLEKLESAERKLDSQSYTGSLREEELDQIRQTLEEELRQQRESMQRTKETMNKTHDAELSSEQRRRECAERDLDEASRRLSMAHEEIRRLSDELDIARKASSDPELQRARQEVEQLRVEVEELKESDLLELQRVKEHNVRLDKEILCLRSRVRSLDSERKTLLQTVEKLKEEVQQNQVRETVSEVESLPLQLDQTEPKLLSQDRATASLTQTACAGDTENDAHQQIHERCRQELQDRGCQVQELHRKLLKLQREHEELGERNEELESILGETQNRTKEERERFESETEGLHRKITGLDAELSRLRKKQQQWEGKGVAVPSSEMSDAEQALQQQLKSSRDREAVLEGCLTEEKEWRKQLEADLSAAQSALKKSKEELQRCGAEMQSLCASVEESSALNASLTQAQEEKTLLERKELQDRGCQVQELHRKLLKLQREHEELGERNEELESILGETQNRTKEERERFESETEGLHRKITGLDAELSRLRKKQQQWEGKGVAVPSSEMSDAEQALQQQLKSSRDREAVLEGCLTEEKEWRKQLEADLSAAQSALKKSKEELQRCGAEMQSLCASVEESSALNASLTQAQEEKTLLERKVCELELSAKRLEGDVEQHRAACSQAQEELRKCREREAELRGELHRAEGEHSTLQGEVLDSRAQGASPQQRLSESVQDRLGLELQSHRLRQGTGREANPEQPQHRPFHRVTEEGVNQLVSLKVEMGRLQSTLEEERLLASQHQLALQAQIGEGHGRAKSQESLLQQMGEECRQLKQDLQRTQNLFSSAERELRYEREKNLDQKRHGALLEQENTKVKAELKQAQSRLAGVEQAIASLSAELESSQQRGRELELELLHRTESIRVQRSLQEEQRAESSRLLSADKKVRELQQQLKGAQHQLRLAETRVQEMEQLQREARDSTESLATLRGRLQKEQLCRKLLEQKGEELQQQLRSLREKEASLSRSNTELNHRLHQQGARLSVLEEEHSTVTDEVSSTAQSYWLAGLGYQHSQKTNQNLSDQLLSCQHESERLQEELRRVLHQLDSHVRRYSEKQARHKAKLRQAKEFFLRETVERDGRIRKLEKDLMLARSLAEKEQEWIRKVTDVNEKLLVEKRELLRRLSEEEELGQTCTRTISTRQHRACQDWDNGLCVFCGVQVKAELKQAQSRLAGVEQAIASLSAELESSQQRGRELELELLHRTESIRVQRSLQEEQRAESSRLLSADKKVRELQQQLKGAQHQLRLAETRVQEMEQLQREARDSTESLATLRGRLQEEQLCRKLLEQKGEELQQQLRSLREKEASLSRSNTELNHRLHQQGARLSVLEEEHSTVTDEYQHSQKTNQNLSDQLLSCQHESERLQEELRRVLHQLDSHVRRYSEKQARHKAKLRQAKEFFLRETVERDGRIRKLEKDLMLARSLAEKEQEWIRKVTDVNEKLLVEKRELLRRLSEEEELGQTCTRTISTRQHRLNCLEEENRQLQDRTLRLSNQVGALERALRSVQSVCSMEEQEWIRKVTDVNEKLLVEKRELLRRLSEEEELGQTCTRTISTRQHRLNCLEEENRQLQDRTLRLSNQVGALERALRSVQSVCSMEELKKAFPTESLLLNGSLLQPSNPSLMAGVCDALGILDAIRRVKASELPESLKSSFSTPRSQPSDIGYLNLSSPAARPGSQDPEESQSLGSDEV
ncbi:UNVERIFIED_CONTAM: hypothetical protein FKN15_048683 [Acipenser sinensis]